MIVPDYFEPLTAYRSWRVQANGLLSGLAVVQPWAPKRALVATCNGHDQARTGDIAAHLSADGWTDAPVTGCVCGIYALKSRAAADAELDRWRKEVNGGFAMFSVRTPTTAAYAIGEVSVWGRVIDHPLGYRAQYAYPKAVTVFGSQEIADRVATLYGVSVERADEPKPKQDEDLYRSLSLSIKPIYWSRVSDEATVNLSAREKRKLEAQQRERERLKVRKRGWKAQPWL